MTALYRTYTLFVALPVFLAITLLTALTTIAGCTLGSANFWGYYPGMLWSRCVCSLLFIRVNVYGREHLVKQQSYVFVANHQGSFDIFLIYGYLGRNFKWLMKKSLRAIPFVGKACAAAGHIFVDRNKLSSMPEALTAAREALHNGTSLVVFPEGSRSEDGRMRPFKRGAFAIAGELNLPVVPMTINGSFDIMPRGSRWIKPHNLTLHIHPSVAYSDDVQNTTFATIANALTCSESNKEA